MQLHLVPPRPIDLELSEPQSFQPLETGIPAAVSGVEHHGVGRWWPRAGSIALLVVALASLLGQGQYCTVDPLLRTPGTALASYWEAVECNDEDRIRACSLGLEDGMPFPGMLWAFPEVKALWLERLQYVPLEADRVVVRYEVHFRPAGSHQERKLTVSTELQHVGGEWRVVRPLGEDGVLRGQAMPTRVDT